MTPEQYVERHQAVLNLMTAIRGISDDLFGHLFFVYYDRDKQGGQSWHFQRVLEEVSKLQLALAEFDKSMIAIAHAPDVDADAPNGSIRLSSVCE